MRHGDKLYDRWVRTHKTRSFVVDFHRYAAEAVALLEGLFHTGGPYQLSRCRTTATCARTRKPGPLRQGARRAGHGHRFCALPTGGHGQFTKAGPAQRELLVEIGASASRGILEEGPTGAARAPARIYASAIDATSPLAPYLL